MSGLRLLSRPDDGNYFVIADTGTYDGSPKALERHFDIDETAIDSLFYPRYDDEDDEIEGTPDDVATRIEQFVASGGVINDTASHTSAAAGL